MRVACLTGGPAAVNTYLLVADDGSALLVDPGITPAQIAPELTALSAQVVGVVATHGHFDHVCQAADALGTWPVPYYMHEDAVPAATNCSEHARWFGLQCKNSPPPTNFLGEGDKLAVGNEELAILEVSGHCPGCLALLGEELVVVGDTLFAGSIGRTDLPGSDSELQLLNIGTKLMVLPDETIVYPGHGPATTIGVERSTNPYRDGWER